MEEEFRIIKDFENYSISNLGNVRNNTTGRILTNILMNGYQCVNLHKNGIGYKPYIHKLIGDAFVLNPDNKPFINHIDNNNLNNKINNLRWCTIDETKVNRTVSCNNKCGVKGVFFYGGFWNAEITHKKRRYNLGGFKTIEEATLARQKKANELFGEFVNVCEKIKSEEEELLELEREFEEKLKR